MHSLELKIDQAEAHYDQTTRIARIAYKGRLHGDVTVAVYGWLDTLYNAFGTEGFAGQIFDFRQVEEFERDNLVTARRTSSKMNMLFDTSQIPAALIVKDFYQEEMLRTGMRIAAENIRKKIVWSDEEAMQFIQKFREEHKSE